MTALEPLVRRWLITDIPTGQQVLEGVRRPWGTRLRRARIILERVWCVFRELDDSGLTMSHLEGTG